MKYIEIYNFVKEEVKNMEFRRFLIVVCAAVFSIMFAFFMWRVPEFIEVLK